MTPDDRSRRRPLAGMLYLACLCVSAACNVEITLTDAHPTGIVMFEFIDSEGMCVHPVQLRFRFPDGAESRGVHGSYCSFGTAGAPGVWEVLVTPPERYHLPPGLDNPMRVTVAKDEVKTVRVTLVLDGPSGASAELQ